MDKNSIISAASTLLAFLAPAVGFLKTPRGKKLLTSLLSGDSSSLDTRIQAAIAAAVSALEAALDVRGQELDRLEQELASLHTEVARLKTADDWKTARIAELETEISELRAENETLRAEIARRRGGRPKKAAE